MAVFEVGSLVFVDYGEQPPCIHARLVLQHVENLDFVVCSPDMDIFTETLDISKPDLGGMLPWPRWGTGPPSCDPRTHLCISSCVTS